MENDHRNIIHINEYQESTYIVEWFKLYKTNFQKLKSIYCKGIFPYRSFSPQIVECIFKLADECGLDNSVKYKCVELYDGFLSEYFILKINKIYNKRPDRWPEILKQCKSQFYLRVMSCMQLISKYIQKSSSLKLREVETILMQKGHRYSRKNILFSEFEVLNLVGYKLNEPSIFTFVEKLIAMISFSYSHMDYLNSTCLLITDFVYMYHQELYDKLLHRKIGYRNYTYTEKLEFLDIECDKITIASAIIVTGLCILNSVDKNSEEISEYLSTVCEKSTDDLYIISSVLMSIINSIGTE